MKTFWNGFEKQAMTAEQKHYAKWVGSNALGGAVGGATGAHLTGGSKVLGALSGGAGGALAGLRIANAYNPHKKSTKKD